MELLSEVEVGAAVLWHERGDNAVAIPFEVAPLPVVGAAVTLQGEPVAAAAAAATAAASEKEEEGTKSLPFVRVVEGTRRRFTGSNNASPPPPPVPCKSGAVLVPLGTAEETST